MGERPGAIVLADREMRLWYESETDAPREGNGEYGSPWRDYEDVEGGRRALRDTWRSGHPTQMHYARSGRRGDVDRTRDVKGLPRAAEHVTGKEPRAGVLPGTILADAIGHVCTPGESEVLTLRLGLDNWGYRMTQAGVAHIRGCKKQAVSKLERSGGKKVRAYLLGKGHRWGRMALQVDDPGSVEVSKPDSAAFQLGKIPYRAPWGVIRRPKRRR